MRKNLTLLVCSLIATLFAVEGVLRLAGIGEYNLENRILFYTFPSWVKEENGAVRYQAHTKVRSVAVYGDTIDYDTTYRTNNLGFYDDIEYNNSHQQNRDIVFIGDSFTAGSGGEVPWIQMLRQRLQRPEMQLYNFGVAGTGVQHFYLLLKAMEKKVSFDEVNILLISNDLFRPVWYPVERGDKIWFCRENEDPDACVENSNYVVLRTRHDEASEDLIERAKEIYRSRRRKDQGAPIFYQRSRLYTLACDILSQCSPNLLKNGACPHLKVYKKTEYKKDARYKDALSIIGNMIDEYPAVTFTVFHIPEKGEVYSTNYGVDVREDMETLGIRYIPLLDACDWQRNMYHQHDGHPNASGYENLANCMARLLQ